MYDKMKKYIFPIIFYTILSIFFSWPLIKYLPTKIIGHSGDPYPTLWYLWHSEYQFISFKSLFYSPYLLSPKGIDLSSATIMPFIGILFFPITYLFGPIITYNIISIFSPVISGWLTFRLAYLWTNNFLASISAGVIFAFSVVSYAQLDMGHLVYFISFSIPLTCLILSKIFQGGILSNWIKDGMILALSLTVSTYTDLQTTVFLFAFLIIFFLFSYIKNNDKSKIVKTYAVSLLLTFIFTLPWTIHFFQHMSTLSTRPNDVAACPDVNCLIEPNLFFSGVPFEHNSKDRYYIQGEYAVYLGLIPVLLSIFGLIKGWRSNLISYSLWGMSFLIYFLFSFGLFLHHGNGQALMIKNHKIYLPFFILHKFPIFRAVMEPVRFMRDTQLSLAILTALGINEISQIKILKNRFRVKTFVQLIFIFLIILDLWTKFPMPEIETRIPLVTEKALQGIDGGGVLFIPVVLEDRSPQAGIDDPWLTMWPMAETNSPYKIPGQYIGNYHLPQDVTTWMNYLHHPLTRYLYYIQSPVDKEPVPISKEIEPIQNLSALNSLALITGRSFLSYYNIKRIVVISPSNTKKVLSFIQELSRSKPICFQDGCYFIVVP